MRLIRFESPQGARLGLEGAGVAGSEGKILDFSRALEIYFSKQGDKESSSISDTVQLAQAGLLSADKITEIIAALQKERAAFSSVSKEDLRLLAPVGRPGKIVCLGLNYAGHARESGREPPTEPIFFGKAVSAIVGPEEPVVYKADLGRVDPEAELAVVIGPKAKEVSQAEAMAYVGGYTVLNDVTAREMQARDIANRLPWYRSKGIDTFCPVGPALVLTDEIGNPGSLNLEMRVNGEVRQRANTSDLIFGVPFLIHYISRYITLNPGDIIATGTPEGIAPVEPGDIMEAWVEGIGILKNPVVAG